MRQPLVAGNWKMNGTLGTIKVLLDGIREGADSVEKAELAVCPPFVYLPMVAESLQGTGITWGAQNMSLEQQGAFTGEVAAYMLNDFNCTYVIIGHSERRTLYGETDEIVAKKYLAAQNMELTPILCVGELLEEREAGETEAVVGRQLGAVLKLAGTGYLSNAVIAYEPVWAIGTGRTATPEQAQEVHAFIRAEVAKHDAGTAEGLRILYGGSMNPGNAVDLLAQPDIDGGLIGGASLEAESFLDIGRAAG